MLFFILKVTSGYRILVVVGRPGFNFFLSRTAQVRDSIQYSEFACLVLTNYSLRGNVEIGEKI